MYVSKYMHVCVCVYIYRQVRDMHIYRCEANKGYGKSKHIQIPMGNKEVYVDAGLVHKLSHHKGIYQEGGQSTTQVSKDSEATRVVSIR